MPPSALILAALSLLLVEGGARLWTRTRPPVGGTMPKVLLPVDGTEGFVAGNFGANPATLALEPSRGALGTFTDSGTEFFYMEFDPGHEQWWVALFMHRPERCMGHAGATLTDTPPERTLGLADGSTLHFQPYRFLLADGTTPLILFKAVWLNPAGIGSTGSHVWGLRARNALLTGKGPAGRLLLAGIRNIDDLDLAWKTLAEELHSHWRVENLGNY